MKQLVMCCVVMFFSFEIYAQITPEATTLPVSVGAELSDVAKVSKVADVHFGGIHIPQYGDVTVTMDYTGNVNVSGGTTTLYKESSRSLGKFILAANKEASFKITAPATLNLKLQGTSAEGVQAPELVYTPVFYSMLGDKIKLDVSSQGFLSTEYGVISIGGNLLVPASSYKGSYSGVMDVNISWL